jgi:hypothetical protein
MVNITYTVFNVSFINRNITRLTFESAYLLWRRIEVFVCSYYFVLAHKYMVISFEEGCIT